MTASQPPLSQQIAQLEREMEVKLFNRTKHYTELTDAGKVFLEHTYRIFNDLEKACVKAHKVHHGEIGKLEIGFTGVCSKNLLHLISEYRSRFPKVEVVLHHLSTTNQVRAFHENRIQVGFLCLPIESDSLESRFVLKAPFMAALPSTHPLAEDTSPLDMRELKNEPFIMSTQENEPGYYETIVSICNNAGFSPNIIQEAEGINTILSLISAGLGVSLITSLALEHSNKGVKFRKLKGNSAMDLSMAWRKDESSAIVHNFLTVFDELFGDKSKDGYLEELEMESLKK